MCEYKSVRVLLKYESMMTRSSSSARINIAASTRKLDVNNRIPLQFYHRIAENILKQVESITHIFCIW